MDKKVGMRIKESRKAKGLTQQELGDVIGVTKTSVMRYEQGRVDRISTTEAKLMAEKLGVNVMWLMGYDDNYDTLIEEEEFKLKLQEAIRSWKDIEVEFTEADIQSIVEFIKFKAVEK